MIFINNNIKYLILIISGLGFIFCSNLDHPCLDIKQKESINEQEDNRFYSFGSNKRPYKAFKSTIENAYLYYNMVPIMQLTRELINYEKYIKIDNNPRYYFLKGIEDLMNKDNQSANQFLSQFINFYDIYLNGDSSSKSKYFQRGCSKDDIDWIENKHKISKEYQLSKILVKYLNKNIDISSAIENIESLDITPDVFDLNDNIIFILMNNADYNIDQYRLFFKVWFIYWFYSRHLLQGDSNRFY